MYVYRYEPRAYEVGEIMFPDFNREPELTSGNKEVEKLIYKLRPELKDVRSRALYTWQSERLVRSFIEAKEKGVKLLQDRNFYKLLISESDILFEADLNYYRMVEKNIDDEEKCQHALIRYVSGKHLPMVTPQIEILVSSAKVVEVMG